MNNIDVNTACVTCDAGFFNKDGLTCDPCSQGKYCPGHNQTTGEYIFDCPPGYYCPEGTFAPIPCPAGTFNS